MPRSPYSAPILSHPSSTRLLVGMMIDHHAMGVLGLFKCNTDSVRRIGDNLLQQYFAYSVTCRMKTDENEDKY